MDSVGEAHADLFLCAAEFRQRFAIRPAMEDSLLGDAEIAATQAADGLAHSSPVSPASDVGLSQAVSARPGPETLRRWKQSAAAFAAKSLYVVRDEADPCAAYARDVETYLRAVYAELADEYGLTCTDTLEGAGRDHRGVLYKSYGGYV